MTATAMQCDRYAFQLDLIDQAGTRLTGQQLVRADFEAAIDAAAFEAFRQGRVAEYGAGVDGARVEPRFVDVAEHPSRCDGFRVVLPLPAGAPFVADFSLRYFAPMVDRLRATWRRGAAENDPAPTHFYVLHALLADDAPDRRPAAGMQLDLSPATKQLTILDQPLAALGAVQGWDDPSVEHLPIYVARAVIEQSAALAQQWPAQEVGGLLLGNVCRDPATQTIYVLVTCLVESTTAQGTATTLTFTPECFAAARRMVTLRSTGNPAELIVGWMHSHPFKLCAECPLPVAPECIAKVLTYSADDVQLMATTFAAPYAIGLLAGVDPRLESSLRHLPVRCFGWQAGEVAERGCFVFDD